MNPFQSFRFFHGMRIQHLGLLMNCATETTYQAGEILFKEGDPVRQFFLVKSGALALHTQALGETRVVKTAQSGDVLGWSCLAPQATWHLSGQALGRMAVTILDGGCLLKAAQENPEFGRELLKRAGQMEVERIENDQSFVKIQVEPLAGAVVQHAGGTATGNSSIFSDHALDLSSSDAKQLSVHDGQWALLTDRHGSAIVPVRVKSEAK